ncbi:Protein kinase domain-containing protein 22 [Elsinoe fawcettii]|nr:Protein kinase domain-containing protein 22 [Elsinoe fawcettii]
MDVFYLVPDPGCQVSLSAIRRCRSRFKQWRQLDTVGQSIAAAKRTYYECICISVSKKEIDKPEWTFEIGNSGKSDVSLPDLWAKGPFTIKIAFVVAADEPDAQPALVMGRFGCESPASVSVRPSLAEDPIQVQNLTRCIDSVACIGLGTCRFYVQYPKIESDRDKIRQLWIRRSICHRASYKEIRDYDWTFVKELGRGTFGVVKLMKGNQSGRLVAHKRIVASDDKSSLKREVQYMKTLKHENIVKCFSVFESPGDTSFVMQLAHGTLADLAPVSSHPTIFRKIGQHVCAGLTYLHERGITHRDIKPENILYNMLTVAYTSTEDIRRMLTEMPDLAIRFCVGDLGFSKGHDVLDVMSVRGTPMYMAPEILQGSYSNKVDSYALGIVFYDIATRRGSVEGAISCARLAGNAKNKSLAGFMVEIQRLLQSCAQKKATMEPGTIWELISRMTQPKPDDRPSMRELTAIFASIPLAVFEVSKYRKEIIRPLLHHQPCSPLSTKETAWCPEVHLIDNRIVAAPTSKGGTRNEVRLRSGMDAFGKATAEKETPHRDNEVHRERQDRLREAVTPTSNKLASSQTHHRDLAGMGKRRVGENEDQSTTFVDAHLLGFQDEPGSRHHAVTFDISRRRCVRDRQPRSQVPVLIAIDEDYDDTKVALARIPDTERLSSPPPDALIHGTNKRLKESATRVPLRSICTNARHESEARKPTAFNKRSALQSSESEVFNTDDIVSRHDKENLNRRHGAFALKGQQRTGVEVMRARHTSKQFADMTLAPHTSQVEGALEIASLTTRPGHRGTVVGQKRDRSGALRKKQDFHRVRKRTVKGSGQSSYGTKLGPCHRVQSSTQDSSRRGKSMLRCLWEMILGGFSGEKELPHASLMSRQPIAESPVSRLTISLTRSVRVPGAFPLEGPVIADIIGNTTSWTRKVSLLSDIQVGALSYGGLAISQTRLGLGLPPSMRPRVNSQNYAVQNYVARPFYNIATTFFRVGLCFTYLRIIKGAHHYTYKKVIEVTMFVCSVHGLVYVLLILFNCRPISRSWDPSAAGSCLSVALFYYGTGISAIILDLVVFTLPIHLVSTTGLARVIKYEMIGALMLSFLTLICSIMRTFSTRYVLQNGDATRFITWGVVEAHVG